MQKRVLIKLYGYIYIYLLSNSSIYFTAMFCLLFFYIIMQYDVIINCSYKKVLCFQSVVLHEAVSNLRFYNIDARALPHNLLHCIFKPKTL